MPFEPNRPAGPFVGWVQPTIPFRITTDALHLPDVLAPMWGVTSASCPRIRARNPAREHVALTQNRHGAAREAIHPPNPAQPPSASAHAKTAWVDPTASCPLDQNDTKVIAKTEKPRLRPSSESGGANPALGRPHRKAARATESSCATARSARVSVLVSASLPVALICTGRHSLHEFHRCSQDEMEVDEEVGKESKAKESRPPRQHRAFADSPIPIICADFQRSAIKGSKKSAITRSIQLQRQDIKFCVISLLIVNTRSNQNACSVVVRSVVEGPSWLKNGVPLRPLSAVPRPPSSVLPQLKL